MNMMSGGLPMEKMAEQSRLVQEIAGGLARLAPAGWERLLYRVSAATQPPSSELRAWTPAGEVTLDGGPVMPLMGQLWNLMHEPGRGSWYTAELDVTSAGRGSVQTRFGYDAPQPAAVPAEERYPELEAYGRELFGRMPGGGGELSAIPLPDGKGVCVFQAGRGGGKFYIAPDRSVMFSPSAESFEQGLAAFDGGERSRDDQLPQP